MKRIILFFLLSFFFIEQNIAQKILGDVTLNYDISAKSVNDNKSVASFEGARFKVMLKAAQSMTEMTSKLGTETTVNDPKNKKAFILKEFSSQKLMINLTPEEWIQKNQFLSGLKFNTGKEQKNISGYNCVKAVANAEDGSQIEVFYSPDYILPNSNYTNSFPDLKGMPAQFTIKSGNLYIIYTLQSINLDFIPISNFEQPKSGFRIMNFEEAMKMSKG